MRLAEFYEELEQRYGDDYGKWLIRTHVLSEYGKTALELLETDTPVRDIWWAIQRECDE